jgi:hypothetical protein
MRARVADHHPRTTFHTVSLGTRVNKGKERNAGSATTPRPGESS